MTPKWLNWTTLRVGVLCLLGSVIAIEAYVYVVRRQWLDVGGHVGHDEGLFFGPRRIRVSRVPSDQQEMKLFISRLRRIDSLPACNRLEMMGLDTKSETVTEIINAVEIDTLHVEEMPLSSDNFDAIASKQTIKQVEFGGVKLRASDVLKLRACSQLESVQFSGCKMSPGDLASLKDAFGDRLMDWGDPESIRRWRQKIEKQSGKLRPPPPELMQPSSP